MRRLTPCGWLVIAAAALPHVAASGAQVPEPVATLLSRSGTFVAAMAEAVNGVVLDEDYSQQASGQGLRATRLRSDLAITADSRFGWIEFRDVYEVDGRPVRDRVDRIVALFSKPAPDALEQARRLVAEGARFNLTPVGINFTRTVNLPLAALRFLRADAQHRSAFRLDGTLRIDRTDTAVLRFTETALPRVIGTPDNAAAQGAFWIEPATGRVMRFELVLTTRVEGVTTASTIRVDFGQEARLKAWLPRQMSENYTISRVNGNELATLSGRAIYSNARRFEVVVEEKAAPEPSGP
jgi:hypothetical protein